MNKLQFFKKEKCTYSPKVNIVIPIALIGIILLSGCTKKEQEFEEIITTEGNKTYRQYLDNYYEVDYDVTSKKISIEIKNPCLDISESCGSSMKPTMNDECHLIITDSCYDFNKLEIGDVVVFKKEWTFGCEQSFSFGCGMLIILFSLGTYIRIIPHFLQCSCGVGSFNPSKTIPCSSSIISL